MNLLRTFSWIDIVFLLVLVRIIYVAFFKGLLNESIKLLGLILTTFLSLHCYSSFLGVLTKAPFFFNQDWLDFISFVVILSVILIACHFIRKVSLIVLKKEEHSRIERVIALFFGLVRISFFVSISVFLFWLYPSTNKKALDGIFYNTFKNVAPYSYIQGFKVYKIINRQTKINKEVVDYYETKKILR